jgi:hypothetical protein
MMIMTPRHAWVKDDDMTTEQKEIRTMCQQWNDIRLLNREDAKQQLSGDLLLAYQRYYEKYDVQMQKMMDMSHKLQKLIDPPQVPKKTKGQRKRDAYAKVHARMMARQSQGVVGAATATATTTAAS